MFSRGTNTCPILLSQSLAQSRLPGQQQLEHALIGSAERIDILHFHTLVDLVNRFVHHAQFHDMCAAGRDEPAV